MQLGGAAAGLWRQVRGCRHGPPRGAQPSTSSLPAICNPSALAPGLWPTLHHLPECLPQSAASQRRAGAGRGGCWQAWYRPDHLSPHFLASADAASSSRGSSGRTRPVPPMCGCQQLSWAPLRSQEQSRAWPLATLPPWAALSAPSIAATFPQHGHTRKGPGILPGGPTAPFTNPHTASAQVCGEQTSSTPVDGGGWRCSARLPRYPGPAVSCLPAFTDRPLLQPSHPHLG